MAPISSDRSSNGSTIYMDCDDTGGTDPDDSKAASEPNNTIEHGYESGGSDALDTTALITKWETDSEGEGGNETIDDDENNGDDDASTPRQQSPFTRSSVSTTRELTITSSSLPLPLSPINSSGAVLSLATEPWPAGSSQLPIATIASSNANLQLIAPHDVTDLNARTDIQQQRIPTEMMDTSGMSPSGSVHKRQRRSSDEGKDAYPDTRRHDSVDLRKVHAQKEWEVSVAVKNHTAYLTGELSKYKKKTALLEQQITDAAAKDAAKHAAMEESNEKKDAEISRLYVKIAKEV